MTDGPPIFYWPDPDPLCCKASGACRERSAWVFELVRGARLEAKRYCSAHADALVARLGDRAIPRDGPTPEAVEVLERVGRMRRARGLAPRAPRGRGRAPRTPRLG